MLKGVAASEANAPMVLDRLGDVHFALGEVENARQVWNKAMAADANDGYLLALISLKLQALPDPKI